VSVLCIAKGHRKFAFFTVVQLPASGTITVSPYQNAQSKSKYTNPAPNLPRPCLEDI
jgi:hypothetical protein